ncbi:MAG TPA: CxxxxCH/CxxCH domain-containing protein [Polyangiaceae bacterium]
MSERRRVHQPRPAFGRGATLSLGFAVLAASISALSVPGCLKQREQPKSDPELTRCANCHGDANRPGDYLRRAAPPKDLMQQTIVGYPGVGAHDNHLNASATHAAVACNECHVIPTAVDSPGHADDGPPGDVTFGSLAKTGDLKPVYDPATRTCQSSYCHGEAWSVWTEPRNSSEACGTCHGLPPKAPHPQSDRCSVCHAAVIDADRHFIAPERHVDGIVDYEAGDCKICHGSDKNEAPPLDTLGNTQVSAIGVGAHQVHLSGGANGRPLACQECHLVPEKVEDPTHADGLPAEVMFTGVARTEDHTPAWDESSATCGGTYCHSPSPGEMRNSPLWTQKKSLDCASCHGLPPALPHPQSANCASCHGAVVAADNRTIIDKARHVNGVVNVSVNDSCTNCHGSMDPAPPVDTSGQTATAQPGVGAHQTHLRGTKRSRAVPCNECHLVPQKVLDSGHLDSALPAELTFSGVALAAGAKPEYVGGTCQSTSCHGAVSPAGYPMGGTNTTPTWTRVNGSQAACGTCHGLPPPLPHPPPSPGYPCHSCHADLANDDVTFTHPERHVDGIITFQLD